ncbi:uncharacterized protein PV09_07867 [Verruconis gallopava]|uniref:Uncharacterized protein n=1 Tax=Verruconis gallopava TaxID=253628 RepID=A0A0D2A1R7_9PEZI|nr:uncharacterized protein PV09_07867 [Verruconis gallopava]KIW00683.1 hypothetical protein PV09_07867 [Verruconis gallopava]
MTNAVPVRGAVRRTSSGFYPSSPTKLSRLPSTCESPRTPCPSDSDAFAFKPEFLKHWVMDDALWRQLPPTLQKAISAVQHAGAAVHTSFERVSQLREKLPEEPATATLQNATASDAIAAKLHEHQVRGFNRARSHTRDAEEYNCSPIPKDVRNVSPFRSSLTVDSLGSSSESTGYASPTAQMSPTSFTSPTSPQSCVSSAPTPFELGDAGARLPTISRRESEIGIAKHSLARRDSDLPSGPSRTPSSRRSSHSVKHDVPRDPASTQYYAELEHLRKSCLVRLRHSARPVDIEWGLAKREPPFRPSTADPNALAAATLLRERFEHWWLEKKRLIAELDEAGKDLCIGIHFSLGWSDTPGLDHEHIELAV